LSKEGVFWDKLEGQLAGGKLQRRLRIDAILLKFGICDSLDFGGNVLV
jgi:hypothetical protein